MDLRRFTQNGCISAFKCRAEVLKSAFLWVWKFCVAFGVLWGTLGTSVCRKCGKVFERSFGRQVFCCEKCRREKMNERRRAVRWLAGENVIEEKTVKSFDGEKGAKYVSIKDAALLLEVSRPTIYRRIAAGELHPIRVSSRTVRVSVAELLADSRIDITENKGDFSVPIKLEEALALYGVSRSKFFVAIKKAGIRTRRIKGVDFFPKPDLDALFPAPVKYVRDEWYSVDEIMEKTGLTRKYIRDFVRKRGIRKIAVGQSILINKKEWDLNRFSKGQLAEEFLTVDQAKKIYHIGQGRFYETVNAAGIERLRDGAFVYFRKNDLDKLFGVDVPLVSDDVIKNYICAKEALKAYHVGQKRFCEETARFCVEKMRLKGFMWYRRVELDRIFGKAGK